MRTELEFFGKRFNMASRARRRRLVVAFYGTLGSVLIASLLMNLKQGSGWFAIMFTLLVGPILGGYFASSSNLFGGAGLVEPFTARRRLKYPKTASFLRPSSLLHPVVDDDPALRVDERVLHRQASAHTVAYRFLGSLVCAGFLLEYMSRSPLQSDLETIGLTSTSVRNFVYLLLQIGYICDLTLPQAILLWTEPDMENPEDTGCVASPE